MSRGCALCNPMAHPSPVEDNIDQAAQLARRPATTAPEQSDPASRPTRSAPNMTQSSTATAPRKSWRGERATRKSRAPLPPRPKPRLKRLRRCRPWTRRRRRKWLVPKPPRKAACPADARGGGDASANSNIEEARRAREAADQRGRQDDAVGGPSIIWLVARSAIRCFGRIFGGLTQALKRPVSTFVTWSANGATR